jgi:hypothetical protein
MKDFETYVAKGYFFFVIEEKVRSQRQAIGGRAATGTSFNNSIGG